LDIAISSVKTFEKNDIELSSGGRAQRNDFIPQLLLTQRKVLLTKMSVGALSPSSHEIIIQRRAD
jgi:hypothetical protein